MPYRRRLLGLYLAFCAGLGVVWLRAAQLQVVDGAYWRSQAEALGRWSQHLEGPRGSILDAHGEVLAEDLPVPQLVLIPDEWLRRERARCLRCGLVHLYASAEAARALGAPSRRPRRCGCQQGTPREQAEREARFEDLGPGEVGDLEAPLGLEPGGIAALARRRLAEVEGWIGARLAALLAEGLDEPFARTKVRQQRADFLHRPVVVATDVPAEVLRAVQTDEVGRTQGLAVRPVLRRRYPQGDFAPHLLGFASLVAGAEEYEALRRAYGDAVTPLSRIGRRGLERAYDAQLYGAPGRRVLGRGEGGHFNELVAEEPPAPGRPLVLALSAPASAKAQEILERHATPEGYFPGGRPSAAFVALDAVTGEILLWAETPRFDLNTELGQVFEESPRDALADPQRRVWNPLPGRLEAEAELDLEAWRQDLVVPEPRSLSRVAQVAVEPGSTFKVLIALAMLDSGLGEPFGSGGFFCAEDSRRPHCHRCGAVGLEEAIARSCNRWFAFGLRDQPQWATWRASVPAFLARLGIGRPPGREVREWSAGTLLRDWWDFPPVRAVEAARERLTRQLGARAPEVLWQAKPGLVASVAGDPEELGGVLARAIGAVAAAHGARRVLVSAATETLAAEEVWLRFEIRLGEPPHWASLAAQAAPPIPPPLAGMAARGRAGATAPLGQGGALWFTARFERRIGRAAPSDPLVIRPQDGRNVAIGQGPVQVTPLQVARAMAVLANGGRLVEARAARAVGGLTLPAAPEPLGLDPRHLERVREGMWLAVNDEIGTARRPPWSRLPARVYGKTGTAQVGANWRPYPAQVEGEPWHHWFAGFLERDGEHPVAFACLLHARREGAASATAVGATYEILKEWLAGPPPARRP